MSSELSFALEEPFLVAALEALAVAADMLVAEDIAEDTEVVVGDTVAVEVAEATVRVAVEADKVAAYASTAELVVH